MADTLQFELVTPARLAYCAPVAMVEVPGELGDFGVLPGHAPFMSIIRPGVVSVHETGDNIKRFFVPSGYAEVNPEGCTVLAEHIRDLAEVDAETSARELEVAKQAVVSATDEAAKAYAERALLAAETLHSAVTGR
jgi:F-type H+-transporting ATPase subunit epsilon